MSLAEVLPNCLDAVAGRRGRLGLAPVAHAVVAVVDGLGAIQLAAHAGHARTLAGSSVRNDAIDAVFPTTTASALATLTTGESPGIHGMVGYTVLDPAHDRVVNQLSGWDQDLDPATWQRRPTVFELAGGEGIASIAIGHSRYRDSGFTRAVLRGAEFRGADGLEPRIDVALAAVRDPGPSVVYLYIPELDVVGHAHGVASAKWIAALEQVDAALARLIRGLGPRDGLLVTADHGMVDVPHESHVIPDASLLVGVRHVTGEPRCLQLHLEPGVDADELADRWRAAEGSRAWIATRAEAVDAGWFGTVDSDVLLRIGDVLIAARRPLAYYVDPADRGRSMVGQHGSLTRDELTIPLIRFGAFA